LAISSKQDPPRFIGRIGIVFKSKDTSEGWPDRFEIKTDYIGMPKGLVGEVDEKA